MQYAIRNAEERCDRIVQQHELCEDLGARGRGRTSGYRRSRAERGRRQGGARPADGPCIPAGVPAGHFIAAASARVEPPAKADRPRPVIKGSSEPSTEGSATGLLRSVVLNRASSRLHSVPAARDSSQCALARPSQLTHLPLRPSAHLDHPTIRWCCFSTTTPVRRRG
jgi:hypothetical protein